MLSIIEKYISKPYGFPLIESEIDSLCEDE